MLFLNFWVFGGWIEKNLISGFQRLYFLYFSSILQKYFATAWTLASYCVNVTSFVFLCFFRTLLAQNLQHKGLFNLLHILIGAHNHNRRLEEILGWREFIIIYWRWIEPQISLFSHQLKNDCQQWGLFEKHFFF